MNKPFAAGSHDDCFAKKIVILWAITVRMSEMETSLKNSTMTCSLRPLALKSKFILS